MQDNTTATLAIPPGLPSTASAAAHWLPVHLDLKGKGGGGGGAKGLDRLSDAELGPFAPGARWNEDGDEGDVGPSIGVNHDNNDASGGSDQQQATGAPNAAAGSAPASAALKATLRGRALAGARWPLPPGVGGLVLEPAPDLDVQEEEDEDMDAAAAGGGGDDDDFGYGGGGRRQQQQGRQAARPSSSAAPRQRSWRAVAAFGELVAWNHDAPPAPTDAAWRLMDFLAVSAAAHGVGGGVAGGGGGAGGAGHFLPPITAADVDAEVRAVAAGGARPPDAVRARPGPVE